MPDAINSVADYRDAKQTRRRLYRMLDAAVQSRPPPDVVAPIHQRISEVEAAIADYERRYGVK